MKKLLLLLAVAGLFTIQAKAQSSERPHCYTNEELQKNLLMHPEYQFDMNELERFTQQYTQHNQPTTQRGSRAIYIIPVVFHILHNYGPENITDAQCQEAVQIMTRDYRKQNADTDVVIPQFQSIIADCEIEFRLANIDPQGNCTNGIEHVPTLLTYFADDASKAGTSWDRSMYLNIWVAYSLSNPNAAAYAHIPGSGSASTDGIMCWYLYCGGSGTSSTNNSRTLTHEAGHHFNLYHPWGQTNDPEVQCGDDLVFDTPITMGWTHCDLAGSVCTSGVIENVQNYMDYSYCDVMFTEGQKTRMHACLNSNVAERDSLWSPANLVATGTDGSPVMVCIPKADFKADNAENRGFSTATCVGTPVHFTDQTWRGVPTSWSWSFPGGVPATSTDTNPSVTYATAGTYDAKLVVTNATGSDSITKVGAVRITGTSIKAAPYIEDFQDPTSFPGADGWVNNPDNGLTWLRWTTAGYNDSTCIKANNFSSPDGSIDEWISPSLDFSNVSFIVTFSFKVSNARRNSSSADELKLLYSTDCGATWDPAWSKSAGALATAGITTSAFTPSQASQWRQESVVINPIAHSPQVRFKFKNISNHGNNTYIDDINITGNIVGVDVIDELRGGFTMYPNPANGVTKLQYLLEKSSTVTIDVKDILGRTVSTVTTKNVETGMHEQTLEITAAGVYFVDVIVNNKHHVRKLVIS